jgi:beta-galactosidase
MRSKIELRQWRFWKGADIHSEQSTEITVPHTWNAYDGQDGNDDYYRGPAFYTCEFEILQLRDKQVYAVFEAVSKVADVWCNDIFVGKHKGGFSRFVFDITDMLCLGTNTLIVMADNSDGLHIYPQQADFTFFGGMYRASYLCVFSGPHFDFGKYGGEGVYIDTSSDGQAAIRACVTGGDVLQTEVFNKDGALVRQISMPIKGSEVSCEFHIPNVQLWQGVESPYLYNFRVSILKDGQAADCIEILIGFREFRVDKTKGFLLNEKDYCLRGVSRHQDRQDMGWALNQLEHDEDMRIIQEVGANSVRLAHYQQAHEVYSICDKLGFVVWAEIPFITSFDSDKIAVENTRVQLAELIEQNYNHASICFWGLANELGIGGEYPELFDNLNMLNRLAHSMDANRPTVIANLGAVNPESDLCNNSDLLGFNMYLGWYDGKADDIAGYLDEIHKKHSKPVAFSEYGADALTLWHSDTPQKKDYTEEYQALVHEAALAALTGRPFIWGSWAWNMFDFAADQRNEGGCKGLNNKGLVTYDRKVMKDSFYIYKAYWSRELFVYITGRRYKQRVRENIDIKIYSNCNTVTLYVNGNEIDSLKADKIFCFCNVKLQTGENIIEAKAGNCNDSIELIYCDKPVENYTMPIPERNISIDVEQWFASLQQLDSMELKINEGFFSVEDTVTDIINCPEAKEVLMKYIADPLSKTNKAMADRFNSGGGIKMINVWPHIEHELPPQAIVLLNRELNKIEKAKFN